MTRDIARIGRPRARRTTRGEQRPKRAGPRRRKRGRQRVGERTRRVCDAEHLALVAADQQAARYTGVNNYGGDEPDRAGQYVAVPRRRRPARTTSLKGKCGSSCFDPLVHHARSCDDNSVKEISLSVTTALNARRAGPDCAPTRHKVLDEFSERFERINLSGIGTALPHKIDATAAQKDENLQSGCNPAICNSKANRRKLMISSSCNHAN